jgi:NitT/TauT family transport system permease protein
MALFKLREPISRKATIVAGALSVSMLIAVWGFISYFREFTGVSQLMLPTPTAVLLGLSELFFEQGLLVDVWWSFQRILIATLMSAAIALPLGVLMGSLPVVNGFFKSLTTPMRFLPITAFIGLLIIWFGIGEQMKIAFLFLGIFFYFLPVVVQAIADVDEQLVQTAYTLGANRRQTIFTVLIPAALPDIFEAFRIMNGIGWTYVVIAETINAKQGIGYMIYYASSSRGKMEWAFAGILVIGVIGVLTDWLIVQFNRWLFRWKYDQ